MRWSGKRCGGRCEGHLLVAVLDLQLSQVIVLCPEPAHPDKQDQSLPLTGNLCSGRKFSAPSLLKSDPWEVLLATPTSLLRSTPFGCFDEKSSGECRFSHMALFPGLSQQPGAVHPAGTLGWWVTAWGMGGHLCAGGFSMGSPAGSPPSLLGGEAVKAAGARTEKPVLAAILASQPALVSTQHSSLLICARFQPLWVGSPIRARNKKVSWAHVVPSSGLPAVCECSAGFRLCWPAPSALAVRPARPSLSPLGFAFLFLLPPWSHPERGSPLSCPLGGPSVSLHRPVTCGTPGHGTQPPRPTKEPSEPRPGLGQAPARCGEGPGLAGRWEPPPARCGVWGQSLDLCSAPRPPEEVRMAARGRWWNRQWGREHGDPVPLPCSRLLWMGACVHLSHTHTHMCVHTFMPPYTHTHRPPHTQVHRHSHSHTSVPRLRHRRALRHVQVHTVTQTHLHTYMPFTHTQMPAHHIGRTHINGCLWMGFPVKYKQNVNVS